MGANISSSAIESESINKKGYIVLCKVGEGAFGKVYKVKDSTTNEQFAIKETQYFDEEGYDRAIKEVANSAALNHINVVKFYEYFVDRKENKLFIKMELCDYNLSEWFTRNNTKNRSYTEGMRMFREISRGIQYIHDHNIIHRDLKPANVLIKNNVCKIADFGLSKDEVGFTSVLGTPLYASPEQANGLWCEKSTDIYPLWLIMFEFFITFDNDTEYVSAMIKIQKSERVLPENFFEHYKHNSSEKFNEANELLLQMLASDPTKRPTIQEVLSHPFLLENKYSETKTIQQNTVQVLDDDKRLLQLFEEQNNTAKNRDTKSYRCDSRDKTKSEFSGYDWHMITTVTSVLKIDAQIKIFEDKKRIEIEKRDKQLDTLVNYLKILQISSQLYDETIDSVMMRIGSILKNPSTGALLSISKALYLLVKNDKFKSKTSEAITRKMITKTLDVLHLKCDDTQVTLYLIKTLIIFNIPEDVEFEYNRVVNIVIHNLDIENIDNSILERCFYLLYSLTQLENKKHIIADEKGMKTVLKQIREKISQNSDDDVLTIAWSVLWNITDENAVVCQNFSKFDGLECFKACSTLFPTNLNLLKPMLGVLGNFAKCPQLRHLLLDKAFVKIFVHHMDWKENDAMQHSFTIGGILSHLLLVDTKVWHTKLPNIRIDVQTLLNAAIARWNVKTDRSINYNSFKPFQQILLSYQSPNESKYWAMFQIANMTYVNPSKYCPYLEENNLLQMIDGTSDSTECPTNIRLLALTVMQRYKSYNNNI